MIKFLKNGKFADVCMAEWQALRLHYRITMATI